MMLQLSHVFYRRGEREILRDLSLSVSGGEIVGISGPSGAGKTSLLLIAAGLMPFGSGEVVIDGQRADTWRHELRSMIGVVLQIYGLLPYLTVEENVALPLQGRGIESAGVAELSQRSLQAVGLWPLRAHLASELSGGQRQRNAIARAIAGSPRVLITDEPTSELDVANRHLVMNLLREKATEGCAILLASHDPAVLDHCDRQLRLVNGELSLPSGSQGI
jgi:putative ABC transport system ATP-binding protein